MSKQSKVATEESKEKETECLRGKFQEMNSKRQTAVRNEARHTG